MGIVAFLFAAAVVLSSQAECRCVRREQGVVYRGKSLQKRQ